MKNMSKITVGAVRILPHFLDMLVKASLILDCTKKACCVRVKKWAHSLYFVTIIALTSDPTRLIREAAVQRAPVHQHDVARLAFHHDAAPISNTM
jgi:hypothetical protein